MFHLALQLVGLLSLKNAARMVLLAHSLLGHLCYKYG